METGSVCNARVASYTIRVVISARPRRNASEPVRRSRKRVNVCCTSGCLMTVTRSTSLNERRRQEIEVTSFKLRNVDSNVDLHFGLLRLAEHAEERREIELLLILDQIGVADVGKLLGALDGGFEVAEFIDEARFKG